MNAVGLLIILLLDTAHCLAVTSPSSTNIDHTQPPRHGSVRDLHAFQLGTWVENLYVRANGHILAAIYTPFPGVYEINPHSKETTLVAIFPDVANALGIAEGREPDTVYIIGEDFPVTTLQGVRGSNSIYKVNLRHFDTSRGRRRVDANLVMNIPNATALNGLAAVDTAKRLYAATDFDAGCIYLLNIATGKASDGVTYRLPDNRDVPCAPR